MASRAPALLAVLAVAGYAGPAAADCPVLDKPFATDSLRADLAVLADPALAGRVPGTEGDRAAREHLRARFRCIGLEPAIDATSYEQAFDKTANLVGLVRGESDDIILVGAHFDALGGKKLGANDNASGVAALLAIAQAIEAQPGKPRRTIVFAAWGAEEAGELGSAFFAAHPPKAVPLDRVVQYINLDMVGSYKSRGFVAAMGTFAKFPARKVLDKADDAFPKLHVGYGGRAERSDHEAFCKQGIPYVFFWTPDARCYHQSCDTIANVDFAHMSEIATLAAALVSGLAASDVDLAKFRVDHGCGQK